MKLVNYITSEILSLLTIPLIVINVIIASFIHNNSTLNKTKHGVKLIHFENQIENERARKATSRHKLTIAYKFTTSQRGGVTFIDTASSALASGAGTARDSLCVLFSRSNLCTLPPAAPCL